VRWRSRQLGFGRRRGRRRPLDCVGLSGLKRVARIWRWSIGVRWRSRQSGFGCRRGRRRPLDCVGLSGLKRSGESWGHGKKRGRKGRKRSVGGSARMASKVKAFFEMQIIVWIAGAPSSHGCGKVSSGTFGGFLWG
jgi:hypothetical protein